MKVKQFFDDNLAHMSYAIASNNEVALIDPARNPEPYLNFAKDNDAEIKAIIETHPHADFVSSHLELHQRTGATIYISKLAGAEYPHETFDEGDIINIGHVKLHAINTPGHSPDSITVLLEEANGKVHAVFTGDTLFIGDMGRPDLREKAGNIQAKREELALQMYETAKSKLRNLDPEAILYPAHGAGSLCGKNISSELQSTIAKELERNPLLKEDDQDRFVSALVEGQPHIPKYFPYNVALNRKGAPPFRESVDKVNRLPKGQKPDSNVLIIDARPTEDFSRGHLPDSIHIPLNKSFETWIGSIVEPEEPYYLVTGSDAEREDAIERLAKIGYELFITGVALNPKGMTEQLSGFDPQNFLKERERYQIIDVRTREEAKKPLLDGSVNIPLDELRQRAKDINPDKPAVVHCAGGSRGATGTSILRSAGHKKSYNLGEYVNKLKNKN